MTMNMEINEAAVVTNIVKIRIDKKISQQEMADLLGVSAPTYSRYESRTISLTFDTLAKIASAFSMRVIDVITYPEVYTNEKTASAPTKVIVELDVSQDEFIKMGLKDKVIQVLNK